MADKKAGPLLDLNTLVERSQVRIDGQVYDLLDPGELGLLDYHRMIRLSATLDRFGSIDVTKATEEEVAEGSKALDDLCRLVLVAPPEVHDKLRDARRNQIVTVFMKLLRESLGPAGAKTEAAAAPPPQSPLVQAWTAMAPSPAATPVESVPTAPVDELVPEPTA